MFISKHQDLQKILFGEIVFDNDFHMIKKIQDDVKDDDDFSNGKKYKMSIKISNDVFIGSTCISLRNLYVIFIKMKI